MLADLSPLGVSQRQPREIALANFGVWQIAVPTTFVLVEKRLFSATIPIPERIYASRGWAIYQERTIARLQGLNVRPVVSANSPFSCPPRLGPGVPLDFELNSRQPLPFKLALAACFTSRDEGAFCTVFRGVRPRFTCIFPFTGQNSLVPIIRQLLAAEKAFIKANCERLQQVPFYRESFNL